MNPRTSLPHLVAVIGLACAVAPACAWAGPGTAADAETIDIVHASPVLKRVKERGVLVIGTSFLRERLNAKNAGGEPEGFYIDIGRSLAKQILGPEGRIEWKEIATVDPVAQGAVDLIIEGIRLGPPEGPSTKADFVVEFFRSGPAILTLKGGPFRSIDDIRNSTRILYPKDNATDVRYLKINAPDAKYIECPDDEAAFEALKAGKGDFITDDVSALYGLAARDPAYTVASRYGETPFYLIAKKGDPVFHHYLEEFVRAMRTSGVYERLYQKWLVPCGGDLVR